MAVGLGRVWMFDDLLCLILLMVAVPGALSVNTPPSHPVVAEFRVIDGQTAVIKCRSNGKPEPAVRWQFANGSAIATRDGRRRTSGGELRFTPFWTSVDYPAIYKCRASNSLATTHSDHVPEIGERPRITQRPNDVIVEQGRNVSLVCAANGGPTPHYTWFKDTVGTQPVAQGFLLHMSNVQHTHHGRYICVAKNWAGEAVARATVTVQHAPVMLSNGSSVEFESSPAEDVLLATCAFSSHPSPTVSWTKDGAALPAKFPVAYSGRDSKLYGSRLGPEDSGRYRCKATNKYGSATSVYEVIVRGPPPAPNITALRSTPYAINAEWTVSSDGNSPITAYIVNAFGARGDTHSRRVASHRLSEAVHINGLLSGVHYRFLVQAVNKYGTGEASQAMGTRTVPTRPYRPNVTEVESYSLATLTASWHIEHDGGHTISECAVQRRAIPKSGVSRNMVESTEAPLEWATVVFPVEDSSRHYIHDLHGLRTDAVYDVKLRCRNSVGWSRWSVVEQGYSPTEEENYYTSATNLASKTGSSKTVFYALGGVAGGMLILLLLLLGVLFKRRSLRHQRNTATISSSRTLMSTNVSVAREATTTTTAHGEGKFQSLPSPGDTGSSPGTEPEAEPPQARPHDHLQRMSSSRSASFSEGLQHVSYQDYRMQLPAEPPAEPTADGYDELHARPVNLSGSFSSQHSAAPHYVQELQRRQYALSRSVGSLSRQASFNLSAPRLNANAAGGNAGHRAGPPRPPPAHHRDPVRLGCYGAEAAQRGGTQPGPPSPVVAMDSSAPVTRRFVRGADSNPANRSGRASILRVSTRSALNEPGSGSQHQQQSWDNPARVHATVAGGAEAKASAAQYQDGGALVRSKTFPKKQPPHMPVKASKSVTADISDGVLDLRRPRQQDGKTHVASQPIQVMKFRPSALQNSKPVEVTGNAVSKTAASSQPARLHSHDQQQQQQQLPRHPGSSIARPDVNIFDEIDCHSNKRLPSGEDKFSSGSSRDSNGNGNGNGGQNVDFSSANHHHSDEHQLSASHSASVSTSGTHSASSSASYEYEVDKGCVIDGVEYPPTVQRVANGSVIGLNSYV